MNDVDALAQAVAALRGKQLAAECLLNALSQRLPPEARVVVHALHETEAAAYRRALENTAAPPGTLEAFDRHVERSRALLSEGMERLSPGAGLTS